METDLRGRYEVNVVAIRRGEQLLVPPQPTEKIMEKDVLFVVGANRGVQRLEELE